MAKKINWVSDDLSKQDALAGCSETLAALEKIDEPYPEFPRYELRADDFKNFDGTRDAIIEEISNQQDEYIDRIFERLFGHFGIAPDKPWSWKALAIALAHKHIPELPRPGLSDTLSQGGAPVKWLRYHRLVLYAYVRLRKTEKPKLSLESIFLAMPKSLRTIFHEAANGTLRREYYTAQKDEKIKEICEINERNFGLDWINQWNVDEKLEIDPDGGAIGGIPNLRRREN